MFDFFKRLRQYQKYSLKDILTDELRIDLANKGEVVAKGWRIWIEQADLEKLRADKFSQGIPSSVIHVEKKNKM